MNSPRGVRPRAEEGQPAAERASNALREEAESDAARSASGRFRARVSMSVMRQRAIRVVPATCVADEDRKFCRRETVPSPRRAERQVRYRPSRSMQRSRCVPADAAYGPRNSSHTQQCGLLRHEGPVNLLAVESRDVDRHLT